jgi:hypothetical protein
MTRVKRVKKMRTLSGYVYFKPLTKKQTEEQTSQILDLTPNKLYKRVNGQIRDDAGDYISVLFNTSFYSAHLGFVAEWVTATRDTHYKAAKGMGKLTIQTKEEEITWLK